MTIWLDCIAIFISAISITICVFYYFKVIQTYKRDRLTGLMLRHNLSYEMEDNINRTYDIVLIDVDNFKLINDKYGHDRGDEVLVTIVNTTLKHLPKGCRMYRFGGDEFVIISNKVSTEVLEKALEDANLELLEDDLRVSYGIVKHEPHVESMVSLTLADKAMYENKRLLKSEDIWDDMTGLYNLRGFIDELDSFRKAVSKDGHIVALVGVDVERLSNINKAYGYAEGNLIITELAKCLKNCLRGRDFIGHLGSDEFVVAIECKDEYDAYINEFLNHLDELMSTSYELSEKDYSVRLNIDKSFVFKTDDCTSQECVDGLLYLKQENKDNRRKNDTNGDKDFDSTENDAVMDMLDNDKLRYVFQPIVSAKDGRIVAYESLMRATKETKLSTLKILKYATNNGRLYDIEKYSLFKSLEKFKNEKNIPKDAKIFINSLPGNFLSDADFELLQEKYGDLLSRMVLEITEQREVDDDSLALLNLRRERNGFGLAIDDYGNGATNTTNLLRYMPQIIKIDRLLITGIDRNIKKQFFVSSIVSFAKENDMQTIAEGVETERELKTVIKLGIDMLQGYVAAKPESEVITKISDNIIDIIVGENIKAESGQRLTYTASDDCELSVVSLAMDDYSKVNVLCENITITGRTEYAADMIIKLKDNLNCNMRIADVSINSIDDRPCIELGENTNLILHVEGNCKLNAAGIYVPKSSSLTIIGGGILSIYAKGHECYAIGADSHSKFGKIELKHSGLIHLDVDGENCVGLGGGIAEENSLISMTSGTLEVVATGVNAVGVGAYRGDAKINIIDSLVDIELKVNEGSAIGSIEGTADIKITNFTFNARGSGRNLAVMGSHDKASGNITLLAGLANVAFSGHSIAVIGGILGDPNISISHVNCTLLGEGDEIVGIGTKDEGANVTIKECSVDLTINAADPLGVGAKSKDIMYLGPNYLMHINGNDINMMEL